MVKTGNCDVVKASGFGKIQRSSANFTGQISMVKETELEIICLQTDWPEKRVADKKTPIDMVNRVRFHPSAQDWSHSFRMANLEMT
jgi:hypothetical protein